MHFAAMYGSSPAAVAALVKAGADLKTRNKAGFNPLQLAVEFNAKPAVIEALTKSGPR